MFSFLFLFKSLKERRKAFVYWRANYPKVRFFKRSEWRPWERSPENAFLDPSLRTDPLLILEVSSSSNGRDKEASASALQSLPESAIEGSQLDQERESAQRKDDVLIVIWSAVNLFAIKLRTINCLFSLNGHFLFLLQEILFSFYHWPVECWLFFSFSFGVSMNFYGQWKEKRISVKEKSVHNDGIK